MIRIKIGLIIVGVIAAIWGGKELMLSGKASDTPQDITCAALIDNGPGGNAHVRLTAAVACPTYFVYEGKTDKGPWSKVYLPALPEGGAWHREAKEAFAKTGNLSAVPAPSDIRVLLKFTNVRNEDHLGELIDAETIQGTIINSIESLDGKEKSLLRQGYPNIDVDRCYILQVGRKPTSGSLVLLATLGGAGAAIIGLLWIIWPKISERRQQAVAAAHPQQPLYPR